MQPSTILAIVTSMASTAAASPAVKRSYAPGQCGIHISQQTRANNDDLVTSTVKDADGNDIGGNSGVS